MLAPAACPPSQIVHPMPRPSARVALFGKKVGGGIRKHVHAEGCQDSRRGCWPAGQEGGKHKCLQEESRRRRPRPQASPLAFFARTGTCPPHRLHLCGFCSLLHDCSPACTAEYIIVSRITSHLSTVSATARAYVPTKLTQSSFVGIPFIHRGTDANWIRAKDSRFARSAHPDGAVMASAAPRIADRCAQQVSHGAAVKGGLTSGTRLRCILRASCAIVRPHL